MFLLCFLEDSNAQTNQKFIDYLEEIFELIIKKDKRFYNQPLDSILIRIIDKIVENYQTFLEKFDEDILKKLDEEVIQPNPQKGTLTKIHRAKSECLDLKFVVQPLRDIFKKILKRNNL